MNAARRSLAAAVVLAIARVANAQPSRGVDVGRADRLAGLRPGTSVTAYRVDGGGHAIPGRPTTSRPALFGGLLGAQNDDFSAPDAILDAFARGR